ncbi:hypothetical protein K491DRAFT_653321 [Lophiostoma macrostomum CBS 122681]|uniref:Maintenance of telomere capping protein 6 n=1 Tax=Lophiostoma macrostomum CBS 122681 TaxID=1314788 RepID=A0A6A6TFZ1_9PLEO|nr:hypothetical protein K491DRAFT_653321 [Lophiostoma macrostomum CBS 122681]
MSLYAPDLPAANDSWDNAFLTTRDVALYVPINFHTVPGTSLKAACFSHDQYENHRLQTCLSNLLAAGFKRFLVDVYWDSGRSTWSLCPAQLPPPVPEQSGTTVAIVSATSTNKRSEATAGSQVARFVDGLLGSALEARDVEIGLRQDETTSLSESVSVSTSSPTTVTRGPSTSSSTSPSGSSNTAVVEFPSHGNDPPLLQIGPYNCTSTINLDLLIHILGDYTSMTQYTGSASISFLTFNIHAAAPVDAPDGPAQKPSSGQLPVQGNWLSDVVTGNLSKKVYTPQLLEGDRINLNGSWYNQLWQNLPARGYYSTSVNEAEHVTTQDGWPGDAFMEFGEFYRVIADFGSIDPQMADYNLAPDLDIIFPQYYIHSEKPTTIDADGSVTSGCLFSPSDLTITASSNTSWAVSFAPALSIGSDPDPSVPIPAIANLTNCGYSPILNTTLSNTTADTNPTPYLAFARSTIWTWAPNQPTNTSNADNNAYRNTCAAMYATGAYPGRWQTVDCTARHRLACHDPDTPYNWTLSASPMQYFAGDTGCPRGYTFAVPRTAVENAHLLAAIRSSSNSNSNSPSNSPSLSASPASSIDPVFINLNSLDVPNCWTAGINGTCPYTARQEQNRTRVVVVPTVAAVLIFLLAALTFFVKCAANRREDKRGRRRRQLGGWEYEGVPS